MKRSYRHFYNFVFREQRKSCALLLLIACIRAFSFPLAAFYAGRLANTLVMLQTVFPVYFLLFECLLFGIGLLSTVLLEYQMEHFERNCGRSVKDVLIHKVNCVHADSLYTPDIYDTISHIQSNLQEIISTPVAIVQIASQGLSAFIWIITLWQIHSVVFILELLPCIALFWAEIKNVHDKYSTTYRQRRLRRKQTYMYQLFSNSEFRKELRTFHLSSFLLNRMDGINCQVHAETVQLMKKQAVLSFLLSLVSQIGLILGIIFLLYNENSSEQVGSVIILFAASAGMKQCFLSLAQAFAKLRSSGYVIEECGRFLEIEEEKMGTKEIQLQDIRFDGVKYAYPGTGRYALRQISCHIQNGQLITIVGENGSGKTTFIKLLMGLITPDLGSIQVDNLPLEEVTSILRGQSAYISQTYPRLPFTIRQWLQLYNIEIDPEQDPIVRSMMKFVDKLPLGYDTPLGKYQEAGSELSSGEWQQLALTCSLIKKNIHLLVCDEPNSALDPIAESRIYDTFLRYREGRICLVVTHRLNICPLADQIFVFHDGEIVEQGTHYELLQRNGRYAEMYAAQCSPYN